MPCGEVGSLTGRCIHVCQGLISLFFQNKFMDAVSCLANSAAGLLESDALLISQS